MNNETKKTMPPKHGPMKGVGDKAKDFKLAIKRLLKELRNFKIFIIISLFLAMLGAVLSILAPNKLKDLTNEITKGLIVNTKNIEKLNNTLQQEYQDQDINNIKLHDITIDNVTISSNDQIKYFMIMRTLKKDSKQDEIYKQMDNLPDSIKKIIEPKMNIDNIKKITFFLIGLYILSALFTYIEQIIMTIVSNKFAKNLRSKISKKINKLPLKYFDKHQSGDILSRVTNDVDTIAQSMNHSLATLVSAITLFLGSLIMMFVTNWIMAITAIAASLIGFVFMAKVLSKSQKYFIARQKQLKKYIQD